MNHMSEDASQSTPAALHLPAMGPTGLFGPTTAMWMIMRENMATLGGLSAVLLQLAHPAIAAAGAHSSRMRRDPGGRIRRTFAAMYEIIFGDLAMAGATVERIHRIHRNIAGKGEGESWRATDPSLLFWVLATLIDSSIRTYELLVEPLSLQDRRDYYVDMRVFGATMGIPYYFMLETWEDFEIWFDGMIHGDELRISPAGRRFAEFIVNNPVARWTGSAVLVGGLLQPRWREAYGMPWTQKQERRFQLAVVVLRGMRRLMPPSVRFCPAYHQALRRLSAAPPESRTLVTGAMIRISRVLGLPWALEPYISSSQR